VFEHFPDNYRWSFAGRNAPRCGAQIGEIHWSLRHLLNETDLTCREWSEAWADTAAEQERRAELDLERRFRIRASERLLTASAFHITDERQIDRGERSRQRIARASRPSSKERSHLARIPTDLDRLADPIHSRGGT